MPTCKFCPAEGSDILPTLIGPSRPLMLCPPCRGMDLCLESDAPLSEEEIARRYDRNVRLYAHLPELVDLDAPVDDVVGGAS